VPPQPLDEGWYLMTTAELESELARWRNPREPRAPSGARKLSIDEALAYRNAGNLPDRAGRTLRLVLFNDRPGTPGALEDRRRFYEPDFLEAPSWRRPGSLPVNVVPLLRGDKASPVERWEDDPDVAALEQELRATGRVGGLVVPPETRGFVFKTILALRRAGAEVTVDSVCNSVARWVSEADVAVIRTKLCQANPE